MPIYKTDKTKNGKTQYKVVVNYTDSNGVYRKKPKNVYDSAEAKPEELKLQKEISEHACRALAQFATFIDGYNGE